jgi:sterol 14-demethylase
MDPFKDIYDVRRTRLSLSDDNDLTLIHAQAVFQMTIRLGCCHELASDLPALMDFQKHYLILENTATPTALLFPWFPGPAKRAKEASTKALFQTLSGYIEGRRKASVLSSDAIDLMLGQGMSNEDIAQFVLSVIFAGVVNTGTNGA